ncbi:substrate-binding domain-containing protein [Cellulomonas sp. NPDC089187]|uniref:substrate-binding domain-containing protein n=1 Tax=Cellulomonas sp. NPDC089187 TaxID=3154970 RepID=UPI00344481F0
MRKSRIIVASLTALSVVGLAACSSGDDSSSGGSGSGEIRVGASLLTQTHPFYVAMKEAMEDEATNQDIDLTVSIADQDLNRQISQVEDFVNQDVDVIVLSPVDSEGVAGAIKKADAAGIPVITVDIAANGVDVASHIATDNVTGGMIAAEALSQFLDGTGEVGLITYPEIQSVVDRIDGFKTVAEQYPGIEIVKEVPGRDRAEAKAAAEDMLTAQPELAGIFGFGDDMALAAAQATASAKSDAVVVGFDGMEEAIAGVDSDSAFQAVVTQHPDEMGVKAMEAAADLAAGEDVEKLIPITPGLYVHGKGEVEVTVNGDKVEVDVK